MLHTHFKHSTRRKIKKERKKESTVEPGGPVARPCDKRLVARRDSVLGGALPKCLAVLSSSSSIGGGRKKEGKKSNSKRVGFR